MTGSSWAFQRSGESTTALPNYGSGGREGEHPRGGAMEGRDQGDRASFARRITPIIPLLRRQHAPRNL